MCAGLCDLYLGQDYVSNESGEGVSVASVADCCERCQMGADCVAFAYYTSGLCFLKHEMGQLMPNPQMTAGIMLRNGTRSKGKVQQRCSRVISDTASPVFFSIFVFFARQV